MRAALLLALASVAATACGPGSASLEISLYTPAPEDPNPFEGVRLLRAVVQAPGVSVPPQLFDVAAGSAHLTNLPLARFVSVVVEGLSGVDAQPLARGWSAPVDLVAGAALRLPVFFAKVDRFAANVAVSTGARVDLGAARAGHTATLLRDGRVLFAGGAVLSAEGAVQSQPLSRAEIYDPQTGAVATAGEMVFPRAFHSATLLKDGRVLVAGGVSLIGSALSPLATAEIFDPSSGTFRATRSLRETNGRAAHTATLLPDGRVLIAGGWGQGGSGAPRAVLASAEIFDPARGAFVDAGPMRRARASHSATLLLDGRVLIAGGRGDAGARSDAEIFDPRSGFVDGPALPDGLGRTGHVAARLGSGLVVVAGGCSAPEPPSASASAASGSGCHGAAASQSILDRVDLFDPAGGPAGRFLAGAVPALQIPRADASATLLPGDDAVLVTGGVRRDGSVAGVAEVLTQTPQGFVRRTAAGEQKAARTFHAATRLGSGLVLLAGGAGRAGAGFSVLSAVELYVP